MIDATVPAAGTVRHLLANRQYRLLWISSGVSSLGNVIFNTTVLLWIATIIAHGRTWAPVAVGGSLAADMVPVILFGPIAGVLADRWDHKRTMLAMDAVRAVLIGALIVLPALATRLSIAVQLAVVYAVLTLASAASQLFQPARSAALGILVDDDDREQASSFTFGTFALCSIIGPPLAAPLIFTAGHGHGVQIALAVNAVSFLASFAAVAALRFPAVAEVERADAHGSVGMWVEFRAGWSYLRTNPTLRVVLAAVVIAILGTGCVNALDVFFVQTNLHVKASLYGLVDGSFGVGSVVGAVVCGLLGKRLGASRLYALGLFIGGVLVIAYSRSSSLAVGMVVLFLAAIGLAGTNTMAGPLIFRNTPPEMLGRVLGLFGTIEQAVSLISLALGSWLAGSVLRTLDVTVGPVRLRTVDTIFLAAGVLLTAAGVVAVRRFAVIARRSAASVPAQATAPGAETVATAEVAAGPEHG